MVKLLSCQLNLGSGGDLNPLGKPRSAIDIIRLRVLGDDAATGRTSRRNIYVEVVTDVRRFTATQLEVLLPKALRHS